MTRLDAADAFRVGAVLRPGFPDGHFYSPVVDVAEADRDRDRIWPSVPDVRGLDFNDRSHREMLVGSFPLFIAHYDYPEHPRDGAPPYFFYTQNTQFSWLDARALFVWLRTTRPRRMIEVGSGFSSLLTADVNVRFLRSALDFTCIEPYPRPFLVQGVPGIGRLIEARIQDVPFDEIERLEEGDILFIDSSHVSKTGSDVNHILFEILPRLRSGVVIHFHDIFLPMDYPEDWVLRERRSWNEQYLVRALLMGSRDYEILFGCAYAYHRFPDLVRQCLGGRLYGGGSLWIRKTR